ncbi:hypothetical protein EGW08_009751, partial [Elysia chlorotica]
LSTLSSTGDNTFSISTSDQISVQSGDQVGWYTGGAAIVDWQNQPGNSGNQNYLTTGASAATVGSTVTFSGTTDEDYAVYATVSSGSSPVFSNLPSSLVLSMRLLTPTSSIFTAAATDADAGDTLTYSLQSASPSGAFSVDSSTGDVSPTSSSTATGTYTLTIRVTDPCGNNDDQDLTITVTNAPPELHDMPVVVDISESAVDETLLHLINATDPDGDPVTCTFSSS